jgi:hypothetical protein
MSSVLDPCLYGVKVGALFGQCLAEELPGLPAVLAVASAVAGDAGRDEVPYIVRATLRSWVKVLHVVSADECSVAEETHVQIFVGPRRDALLAQRAATGLRSTFF